MTEVVAKAWPKTTELLPIEIAVEATMLPTKMLEIPIVAVEPNAHQTFPITAPFSRTIAEDTPVVSVVVA